MIRDKLPEMLSKLGIEVSYRVMEEDEYLSRLKDKLLEEAREVVLSSSKEEICEEMADLL